MTAIQLLVCAGMVVGVFLILRLKPVEFTDSLPAFLLWGKNSIQEDMRASVGREKAGPLKREITKTQAVLEMTGRNRRSSLVCAASLALFCTGGSIAILLGDFFMVPVLAVGFMFLPLWYVKLTANRYRKDIAAELETALSVITTAYLRTEDIVTAMNENIVYLDPPASKVFWEFLMQIKLVDPDVEAALRTMKSHIDSEVFREWYDALCDYQHDHSLRTTLAPIVARLSDMRNVNAGLEYLIAEPRKEFLIMVFFVAGDILLIHLLNQEWYDILIYMPLRQITLAVIAAVIFISTNFVAKLTHPIEYRR